LISALLVMHRSQIRGVCLALSFPRIRSGGPWPCLGFASEPSLALQQKIIQKQHLNNQQTHQSNNRTQQSFKIEHYPWTSRSSRTQTSTVRMYSFPLHNDK